MTERQRLERKKRMNVLLWAYAYEMRDDSLVDDFHFDRVCYEIDLSIDTDRPDLDEWFRKEFDPCTGSWIRSYPDLEKIMDIYDRVKEYERGERERTCPECNGVGFLRIPHAYDVELIRCENCKGRGIIKNGKVA